MKKELQTAVDECREYGGLPRCFLNQHTSVRCPYMGSRTGYWQVRPEGVRLDSFYSCLRYHRAMEVLVE